MPDPEPPDVTDAGGVVRIGSVLIAVIRPEPGQQDAFDHWYGHDHFYTTGLAAPGVFSAARFFDAVTGHHLALYFVLPGHEHERAAWATAAAARASREGRGFAARDHLHTWRYEPVRDWMAQPGGVPPALSLDHHYPALTLALCEGNGASAFRALRAEPHVDVAVLLAAQEQVMPSAWGPEPGATDRTAVLAFHRRPPVRAADAVAAVPGVVRLDRYVPVVAGTDAGADD